MISYVQNDKIKNEFVQFDDSLKLTEFKNNKIKLLQQKGYESAFSFIEKSNSDTIKLWIIEGNQYIFNIETIHYSDSNSLRLNKKMEKSIQTNGSYSKLKQEIENCLNFYENSGYPFTSIFVDSVKFDKIVSAKLFVQQNKKYDFDSIAIKGDAKISISFVRQFFGLNKKEPYSDKKLNQLIKLSKQIPFLSMNQSPEVLFNDEKSVTYIFLNKRKSNSFDGIIGFLPATDNSKAIQLTGDLKLKLNNLFAHGEQLNLDWRGYEANSQDINLKSIIPFLFSSPFGTELLFKLNKKDSSFINLQYQIGINYYISGFDNIKGFYQSSTSNTFIKNPLESAKFRSSKFNSYGIEIGINRLNDIVLATRGYILKTSFSPGIIQHNSPQNEVAEKNTRYLFQLQLPIYIPLYKRFIFASSFQSNYINSKKIYDNEMLRFGGLKTLKGFNEDELLASFYGIIITEVRFMLEKYSYFSIFWNGAYYQKQGLNNITTDTPWGVGVGLAFNTPAGIFNLNYALGKQYDNPLDLRNSKIHFGITSNF